MSFMKITLLIKEVFSPVYASVEAMLYDFGN
jgi:hypothetical protein